MIKKPVQPNCFILGAPKCGTTSLAEWMGEHPNIFMSPRKEPHYYNKDHKHVIVHNYGQYLSLFKNANESHKIVGEASVWYLYSKVAVKNILMDIPLKDVKFVVMLRNPTEMAYSLHEQQVFNLNEPEKNFKKAWNLQDDRKRNKKVGISTRDPQLLVYGEICRLGAQVEQLFEQVPKVQVKIIVLDDIKENALKVYRDLLSFLELPYDGRIHFTAKNTAKVRKFEFFALLVKMLGKVKHALKIKKGFGLLNKVDEINLTTIKREPMDANTEKMLKVYFKEDIDLLSKLIDRDLTYWHQ
jgi:Sulfotransferase domain